MYSKSIGSGIYVRIPPEVSFRSERSSAWWHTGFSTQESNMQHSFKFLLNLPWWVRSKISLSVLTYLTVCLYSHKQLAFNKLHLLAIIAKISYQISWPISQCQQGRQERTLLMQGTDIGSNDNEIGVSRRQRRWRWQQCRYVDSVDKARARGWGYKTSTGKARAMWWWCHHRGDKGEGKWLVERGAEISSSPGHCFNRIIEN
jgi:hypothetical protein